MVASNWSSFAQSRSGYWLRKEVEAEERAEAAEREREALALAEQEREEQEAVDERFGMPEFDPSWPQEVRQEYHREMARRGHAYWAPQVEAPDWPDRFLQEHEDEVWGAEINRMNEAREDPARDPELRAVQLRFDQFEAGRQNGHLTRGGKE